LQTVHDLNHLYFGSFPQKLYYRFVLLRSLCTARAIFSVSEAAALELRGWLSDHGWLAWVEIAANAITRFPEADDSAVLRRLGLEKGGYFFALSNPKPHKNLALLKRAYASARAQTSLPPLIISASGDSGNGVLHTGPLTNPEVGALLRHAKAFFFPSLYEGFGRPGAEAALAGTVPVVSSIPAHREALEGVHEAIFLDPRKEPEWKDSFLRMSSFTGRVGEASKKWIEERWSVERLAGTMDRAYRKCLSPSG
jgi:glycosyltransferase involved in cell wall biosynthesis